MQVELSLPLLVTLLGAPVNGGKPGALSKAYRPVALKRW